MNRYQASSEHHPSITYLPLSKISHNAFSHHRTDMCNFTRVQDKGQREQLQYRTRGSRFTKGVETFPPSGPDMHLQV